MKVLILFAILAVTYSASSVNVPYQTFETTDQKTDGNLSSQRIINGLPDTRSDTPYYAYIRAQASDASSVYCGGAILSVDRVLTAASCLQNAITATISFGASSRENLQETGRQNRQMNQEFFQFNLELDLPDLAIIIVDPPIEITQFTAPIPFATTEDALDIENLTGFVSGFGRFETGSAARSPILRFTFGTVLSSAACSAPPGTTSPYFCLETTDGAETAYGDGGSPVAVITANNGFLLIGIVTAESFEIASSPGSGFSSFTPVAPYSAWITGILRRREKNN